ncbi:allantoinase [Bacillus methanolicus PB1]|uniref:Allantoinase n=1 Tax=Bacillus methanolicus PB1 TaxID=997296 RepID=I3E1R7_BACMT|nr:allantoinase AllB [Bacillus methanolicus]EIJ80438.1 allantoinase [Bacillus methanolicus PB1]
MEYDVIIKNGNVVFDKGVKRTSIAIKDGVIWEISDYIDGKGNVVWNAEDLYVFPGVIDIHVHFSEPGREDWEGFATGSYMLAAGGCTTYFDMPLNGIPSTVNVQALIEKAKIGEAKSFVDFGLWGGLVPGNEKDLTPLAENGVVGFKGFMSPSGNKEFEAVDDYTLLQGMKIIAELNKILALHAEDGPMVQFLQREKEQFGLNSADDYLQSRPVAAEWLAVRKAITYAELTGCSLHFVHISSAEAVEEIQQAKKRGLDVTLETCPHYLLFNHEDVRQMGAIAKCAPPLREPSHQKKLIDLFLADQIDFVSSDHSPSPWELKDLSNNFFKVWGGISGGQFTLMAMIELSLIYNIPFSKIIKWTSERPAKRFGFHPQKGSIAKGADADLVIISLKESRTIREESLYSKNKHSIYINHTFPCKILGTFSRGKLIYKNGEKMASSPTGHWITGKTQKK